MILVIYSTKHKNIIHKTLHTRRYNSEHNFFITFHIFSYILIRIINLKKKNNNTRKISSHVFVVCPEARQKNNILHTAHTVFFPSTHNVP